MVPRHNVFNIDLNSKTLLCLRLQEWKGRITDCTFAVVLQSNCFSDGQNLVVVLNDGGSSDDLESLEFFVRVTTFNEASDFVVATQVDNLLALAESPESDLAIHDDVPHGHEMRVPRRSDGRDIKNGLSFEIGRSFGFGHRDGGALICHMVSDPSSPLWANRAQEWGG